MNQTPQKIIGEIRVSGSNYREAEKRIKNISDFKNIIEGFFNRSTTELLEILLTGSAVLQASDIHIEPQKEKTKIRIRIDGVLQDLTALDSETGQKALNRVKLISGLKINASDKPQDGRFSVVVETKKRPIEIRVSTIPAEYGESLALRVLNPESLIGMEELGLRKYVLAVIEKEIKRPNGMVLVTGPTGSGKSTTLYAFLQKIQKPAIKIITIEDPIEYHLKSISQTQVDPKKGYGFAAGLKSIMRQDPDVILVGEIRDKETAETAIQAALTGHLVLTTLHTNEAVGTIARLRNFKINASDIGPAINVVIAQRLVRRVCEKCSEQKTAPSSVVKKIKIALSCLNKKLLPVGLKAVSDEMKIPFAKGCEFCNFTGYKGRIGIFEVLLLDNETKDFILTLPSITKLKQKVIEKGMLTMYQDGILKVLEGITTIEEIERVIAP